MRILSVYNSRINCHHCYYYCSNAIMLYSLHAIIICLITNHSYYCTRLSNHARHRGTLHHSQWVVSDNPGLACSGTSAWTQEQDRIVRRSSPSSSARGSITQITPSIIVPLACRSPQLTSVDHLLYFIHFCIVLQFLYSWCNILVICNHTSVISM